MKSPLILCVFIVSLTGMAFLAAQTERDAPKSETPKLEAPRTESPILKTVTTEEINPGATVPATGAAGAKPSATLEPKTAKAEEIKPSAPAQQDGLDCGPVVAQLRQNVQKAPTHVLTLVEDAVIANGGHCVGELVQAAIQASKADAATVKKIVFVAITNAPKQAPLIAEVAVAASPTSADAVRAAFAEAFDDKNPRLQAMDPAAKPAWEQANSGVPAPKTGPAGAPKSSGSGSGSVSSSDSGEAGAPASVAPHPSMASADTGERNPDTNLNAGNDWELLHDGVIEPGQSQAAGDTGVAAESIVPPPPLEEEKRKLRFGGLGFLVPRFSLPPVEHPVDLYFSSPFGGIPAP